jgi:hypothetical protein
MWFTSLWNWFVGEIWKWLEKQAKEGLECHNQSLSGHSGGSSEDQNVNGKADSEHGAYEVSHGDKAFLEN